MNYNIGNEIEPVKNSALTLMVGELLGSGSSRRVYELLYDKSLVLKVEYVGKTFNNQTEFLIWQCVKEWPISDWFVPCVDIDSYGNVLIQKRTQPFSSNKEFRAAVTKTRGGVIPAVFDDIHFGNFGLYDGQVACHDYGYHKFFEQVAREMSIDAGYIKYDAPYPEEIHDFTDGGQLALDI